MKHHTNIGETDMIIRVPKEIKNNENRVALTPGGVSQLIGNGHRVLVESGAGLGSGFTNEDYVSAGAEILEDRKQVWDAEMVMKVKEPLAEEYAYFRQGLVLFTYLHLVAEPELAKALTEKGVTAIAYETVTDGRSLPPLRRCPKWPAEWPRKSGLSFLKNQRAEKEFY